MSIRVSPAGKYIRSNDDKAGYFFEVMAGTRPRGSG